MTPRGSRFASAPAALARDVEGWIWTCRVLLPRTLRGPLWFVMAGAADDPGPPAAAPNGAGSPRPAVGRRQVESALAVAAVAAVAASALAQPLRWPVLVILVAGVSVSAVRGNSSAPIVWLAGALIPLQVRLADLTVAPPIPPSLADCANPLSPLAVARLVEAAIVLGAVVLVARVLRAGRASLGLRLPSRRIIVLSNAGPLVLVPVAIVVGTLIAPAFFGPIPMEFGLPLAIVPATMLALANASTEEVVFRGAIQGWGAPALGVNGALVAQALLFGITHVGPDFRNGLVMLPVLGAVTLGGLAAGIIARRTGSLLLPIAIHAALDVPLYYAFACRLPA